MTLVLSLSTHAFALHVSDRLVSRGGKPYDPMANKTVVFRATDGLMTFGYTGPAYLEGTPTDTWIAEAISGESLRGDGGAVRHGTFSVSEVGITLAQMSHRLRRNREFWRLGGEIAAAGWQWNSKRKTSRARNVLWVLHRGSGELEVAADRPERYP